MLSESAKRKESDDARRGLGGGPVRPGGGLGTGNFDFGDRCGGATTTGPAAGAPPGGLGDLLGGLFGAARGGAGTRPTTRPRRGADVETEVRLDFLEAVGGATVPLRLSSPATCTTCAGIGARPGSRPRVCTTCGGAGLVSRSQGAFAFSEPCRDCRGTGRIIDDPCPECGGDGISSQTRTLTVRVPPGVADGQRIRLAGQGEPGRNGAPAGDLYVIVHVAPHSVFGRSGDDLTVAVPVTFPELVLGTTIRVPTLSGPVSLKVPPGTASGRILRVRGRGVTRKNGTSGDLLVTLQVAIPQHVNGKAADALRAYAEATAGHNPRSELDKLLEGQ